MDFLRELESRTAKFIGWFPQFPAKLRKGLAKHVWWIVAIGSVLGTLGAVGLFMVMGLDKATLVKFGYDQALITQVMSPIGRINLWITLIFYVIVVMLAIYATPYLKKMQKRGWTLLFIAMILTLFETLVLLVVNFSIGAFIGNLVIAFIGFYLLFQVRESFKATKATRS